MATRDPEMALYKPLWHACAGPAPLVRIPTEGDLVFYFPQGHLEQVEALSNQVIDLPINQIPSKILCRVINVQLKAEPDTDEVCAQLGLLPELTQDEDVVEMEPPLPALPDFPVRSFCKVLTPSDTTIHGGLSVPTRHAVECFPPLDMSGQPPKQELLAMDLYGNEWRFEHIYKGQPRRHMLGRGWKDFVSSKRPVVGDAIVFLRGENGQHLVGLRRAMKRQSNFPSSIISGPGMCHEVLANVWKAYTTRNIFTINYKPRTSPAEFIVPYNQYMESMRKNYSIGMRFLKRFESEAAAEKTFNGAIVGIEDADPVMWMGSKWRCLKVRWDQNGNSIIHFPERVSPWEIAGLEDNMLPSSISSDDWVLV